MTISDTPHDLLSDEVHERTVRMGWTVAVATLIALIPNGAALGLYAQGYFIGPMSHEFGWSRTEFTWPISLALVLTALLSPIVGRCADRWGVRRLLLLGILIYGCANMLLAYQSGSLIYYSVTTIFVGVVALVQSGLFYAKAVANWAPSRMRGLMLGVGMSGVSIGNLVIPLVAAYSVSEYGWRGGRIALGMLILLVALPPILLFIRDPKRFAASADEARQPIRTRGSVFRRLIRDPVFLLIAACFGFSGFALNGLLAHLVPMLTDSHFDLSTATAALGIMAVGQMIARPASGWLLDRIQTPKVAAFWLGLGIVGIIMVAIADSVIVIAPALILVGLSVGAQVELSAYFATRYFGLVQFGEVYGLQSAAYTIGSAVGALLFGLSYDALGSYLAATLVALAVLVASCIAVLMLPPYKHAH